MKVVLDLKREARWLLACNALTISINIFSILHYQTAWMEIITQLGWTILMALAIYAFLVPVRVLFQHYARRKLNSNPTDA